MVTTNDPQTQVNAERLKINKNNWPLFCRHGEVSTAEGDWKMRQPLQKEVWLIHQTPGLITTAAAPIRERPLSRLPVLISSTQLKDGNSCYFITETKVILSPALYVHQPHFKH